MPQTRPENAAGCARPLCVLSLTLVVGLAFVLYPVLGAISVGGFAALVAHRPHERLVATLGGRRTLAAGLASGTIALAIILPLIVTGTFAAREATDTLHTLAQDGAAAHAYEAFLTKLPASARRLMLLPRSQDDGAWPDLTRAG